MSRDDGPRACYKLLESLKRVDLGMHSSLPYFVPFSSDIRPSLQDTCRVFL